MRLLRKKTLLAVITGFMLSIQTYGQDFHSIVKEIYNFYPATLNDEERTAISSKLDTVWMLVESDTAKYLPELRKELTDSTHFPFFYFNGSSLLMSLSTAKSDLELISKTLLMCELDGVSHFDFFRMAMVLSHNQINTLDIAKKILKMEEWKPFVFQHAMYWEKDVSLVWLLYPLDNKMYVNEIIPLFNEVNDDSKMAIISFLWYSCTCEGDIFIKECSKNTNLSKDIQNHAEVLAKFNSKNKKNNNEKYNKLISKRKDFLHRIGDEVLMEFVTATKKIKETYTCRTK